VFRQELEYGGGARGCLRREVNSHSFRRVVKVRCWIQRGLAIHLRDCPLLKIAGTDPLGDLVSKHRDRPYHGGRSGHRVKLKNRKHHAFDRVKEALK
jgi:hypothetical protein